MKHFLCETTVNYFRHLNLPKLWYGLLLFPAFIQISIPSLCIESLAASEKDIPLVAIIYPKRDRESRMAARSLKRQMRAFGYKKHKTIRYRTRKCDVTATVVKKHVRRAIKKGAKVVVSFTEPVTRYVIDETQGSVPVLFCMSKDQAFSHTVEENARLTGVFIQHAPSEDVLSILRLFLPSLTKLGVLYGPDQDASDVNGLLHAAGTMGIDVTKDFTGISERGELGDMEAVLITDWDSNAALSEKITTAYFTVNTPVFSEERVPPGKGVLACITMAPGEKEGRQLGVLLDRLLKGESCKDIAPVEMRGRLCLLLDLSIAKQLGRRFSIPPASLELRE